MGRARAPAEPKQACMRSTSAARCYGFTEAECPLTPQAPRRRPGSTGRTLDGAGPGGPRQGPCGASHCASECTPHTPVDSRPLPSHIPVVGIDRSELDTVIDCVAEQWLEPLPRHIPVVGMGRSESAISRSARAEWACACACGQPGLMVAYFPSRCCGDNHTVFGLHLCAQVHRCISLHESQGHSGYVHLPTQG